MDSDAPRALRLARTAWPSFLAGVSVLFALPAKLACAKGRGASSIPSSGDSTCATRPSCPTFPCRPRARRRPSAGRRRGDTRHFSLDDAIRIALENDRVIRVLAGVTAVTSGRTIYDAAIANTVHRPAAGPVRSVPDGQQQLGSARAAVGDFRRSE